MQYKIRSADLQQRILDEGYYVPLYEMCLLKNNYRKEAIEAAEYSDEELCEFWNYFWLRLPDDKSIRVGPFFELCDLCEEILQ